VSARVLAVVPTLGHCDLLGPCLDSLVGQEPRCAVVVVDQREAGGESSEPGGGAFAGITLPDGVRRLTLLGNRGFAGAVDAALRHPETPSTDYLALVNDDVLLEPGWLGALVAALDAESSLAAAQGVNLTLPQEAGPLPDRIDGVGLAWNRWWQAVQLLHGRPASSAPSRRREVFGVAATAALYRRSALAACVLPGSGGAIFDERLFAYYEDVDLAGRLRGAGFAAAVEPAARARHRGSATGLLAPRRRLAWIYGNRWLVVARLLGRRFPLVAPRMLIRDAIDVARALARRSADERAGIAAGMLRALRLLPRYLRTGPALVGGSELARHGAERWERELPPRPNGSRADASEAPV
jgi:GT2 family glycosyltransferase